MSATAPTTEGNFDDFTLVDQISEFHGLDGDHLTVSVNPVKLVRYVALNKYSGTSKLELREMKVNNLCAE